MKAKLLFPGVIVLAVYLLFSFTDPVLVKRITDSNFKYEFYTTLKKVEPEKLKTYYWFKGGAVHNSQSGMAGELLNDSFTKMFLDNQLAEQGQFKNGLKIGTWKTWHQNGKLESSSYWANGFRDGSFYTYSVNGEPLEKGYFRKDKKHGKWIDFIKKDTTLYKTGSIFIVKPKPTKEERKALRESKAKAKKEASEAAKKQKATKDKSIPKSKTAKGKPGFFERLFGKKQKK